MGELVKPRRMLKYIGDRSSRSTREGWTKTLNEAATEACRSDKLTRRGLDEIAGATLDPMSEPDVEAAWSEEIERRLMDIDARTVELIPWDDVRSELFGDSE